MKKSFIICVALFLSVGSALAEEPVDLDMVTKIRDEGFNRSEVMESLRVLTDEIGPRMTASPGMRAASKWTVEQLEEWGLEDVHLESFEFGRGWSAVRSEIHMTSPRQTQLYGLPVGWHPSTGGVLEGEVIFASIKSKKDFKKWEGKLKDKIVLVDNVGTQREPDNEVFIRYSDEELDDLVAMEKPRTRSQDGGWSESMNFLHERSTFLTKEGALALVYKSWGMGMMLEVDGYQYHVGKTPGIPAVVLVSEHYARLKRLADNGHAVRMSVDVEVNYYDDDTKGYSTIAEIRGKGSRPEIVMAGAHIDSHSAGDGAADNAAGVAVVMEAIRILKALDVKPKRTIRIGLWSGEENEYWGSGTYVSTHFANFPRKTDEKYDIIGPYVGYDLSKAMNKERDYEKLSAYFNLDNGSGKIRGVYAEGNAAARPIFEAWLKPFHDLDATHVSLKITGGTDHESFQQVGLPGYQFIQDPLDYDTRLHHTQIDLYDHVYENDLKQASVVMASFLYHAAMRDERMPRKAEPVPQAK